MVSKEIIFDSFAFGNRNIRVESLETLLNSEVIVLDNAGIWNLGTCTWINWNTKWGVVVGVRLNGNNVTT